MTNVFVHSRVLSTRAWHLFAGKRFLRFLVVGAINTIFGYALFYCALALLPTTFLALCVSTILGILFNFLSTGSLVFGSRDPRRLGRFFAVYAIIFLYNAAGLTIFESADLDPRIGGLMLLPGAVVISYLLNRSFVFGAVK